MNTVRCTALLLARGGSKRIIGKNMCELAGKPLIYWSIKYAQMCPHIENIVISSDDRDILHYSRSFGEIVTVERPEHLAGDFSSDLEGFTHCLNALKDSDTKVNEYIVHLRATNPFRKLVWMEDIIQILRKNPKIDTVRSIELASDTPFKMWFKGKGQLIKPAVTLKDKPFSHSLPKQSLPIAFRQNAHLDIIKLSVLKADKIVGDNIYGYETESSLPDIDLPLDLQVAREHFSELIDKALIE